MIVDNCDFDEEDQLEESLDMLRLDTAGSLIFTSRPSGHSTELGASSIALKDLSVHKALEMLSQNSERAKYELGKSAF